MAKKKTEAQKRLAEWKAAQRAHKAAGSPGPGKSYRAHVKKLKARNPNWRLGRY